MKVTKYVPPVAPQPIGGVIDDAIRLFRASWSRSWFLAIIPGVAGLVVTFALPLQVPTNIKPSLASLLQSYAMTFTPRVIGLYFVLMLVSLVFQGAVLAREAAIAAGNETASAGDAIATGLRRLLWMIVGAIFFAIIVCIGFIALLIPGVWLWGRLMLWMPALFVDDQNALEGLGTSWRLTHGNWWRATIIASVAIIIAIVLALVCGFIGTVATGILVPVAALDVRGRALFSQSFSIVGNAVYIPLMAAMWIAMYRDLKLRREGGDLESRAAALGSAA